MDLLQKIKENAKKLNKRIVLPEGLEERTLKAADILLAEGICRVILLGSPEKIKEEAEKHGLNHISKAELVDPLKHEKKEEYANLLYELRKHKGLTKEEAVKFAENPLYLATLMIKNGDADGEVAGAQNATGDVLRPAFQIVKTLPGISVVSGAFIMILKDKGFGEDGLMVLADCAVHPNPTASELAEIAVATGKTTRAIAGFEPRIAMLSFSTKGSAKHEMVDKVVKATELAKEMAPDLQIDGEMQSDAAIVEAIGKKKAPDSKIAGRANVLVFPTLETGNIAYKLVQRIAHAEAVGPILQDLVAITCNQAQ